MAQELKIVAKLISGGLNSKIYVLSLGGFDTHAYQVAKDNPAEGMHSLFLKQFSEAVETFVKDLKALKCYNNVSILTYSEFGRQIKSNSAFGTDHGDATAIYLFGSKIKNQVLGKLPCIAKEVEKQQGLDMEIDFRNFYGSLLNEWFDVPLSKMDELFKIKTNKLDIFTT